MNSINININKIQMLLLFLMCMNFMNRFYIIFLLFFAFSFFHCFNKRITCKAVFRILLLFVFSVSYLLSYIQFSGFVFSKVIVILSFMLMFIIGYNYDYDNSDSISWKKTIWIGAFGFASHGILNFIKNIRSFSFSSRVVMDFWLNSETLITGQICLFIIIASLSYYIFSVLRFKRNPCIKLLSIICLIIGLIYNALFSTRTVIYVAFFSLLIGIMLKFYKMGNKYRQVLRYVITILLITLFTLLLYYLNVFGIRDLIESTPLYIRIQEIGLLRHRTDIYSREVQISTAFKQLLKYPFGHYQMQFPIQLNFIHNTWLNIAYGEGLIPCVSFFLFCVLNIFDSLKIIKSWSNISDIVFIVCIYFGLMLYFSIEPVCEASPGIITFMCLINGLVCRKIENKTLT